jgi:hypothetical protein
MIPVPEAEPITSGPPLNVGDKELGRRWGVSPATAYWYNRCVTLERDLELFRALLLEHVEKGHAGPVRDLLELFLVGNELRVAGERPPFGPTALIAPVADAVVEGPPRGVAGKKWPSTYTPRGGCKTRRIRPPLFL